MIQVTEEPRWWRWLAVLALAVGLAVRAWPWLAEPLLFFEDGTVFFGPNYSQFAWGSLLEPYAGYVPYGSNIAAVLLCRLPTECIPSAFVFTAACMQLAAGCSLLRPAWAALAPFSVRVLLAAIVVLLPLASYLEFTTLAYMQWPMLAWLFLLLAEPAAQAPGRWPNWLQVATVVVLTFAHPLAMFLAPLLLLRRVRTAQRSRWLGFVGALAAYWSLAWLLGAGQTGPESTLSLMRLASLIPALLVRVGLECFVGFEGWQWLAACGAAFAYAAAVVCWLVVVFAVKSALPRWPAATRTFACACAWLLVAPLAASLLARDLSWDDQWIVRYFWLSRIAFVMVGLLAMTTLLPRGLTAVVAIACAGALTFGNARFHNHGKGAQDVQQFVTRLRQQEDRDGGRHAIRERFLRPKQPPVVIRPR